MKTLKEMIAVMQAAEDGKQIQARSVRYDTIWVDVEDPSLGLDAYRISCKARDKEECWV